MDKDTKEEVSKYTVLQTVKKNREIYSIKVIKKIEQGRKVEEYMV